MNANVLRSPAISASAKALYCLLTTYADEAGVCWPSNETLAESLGLTERTIQNLLAELVDKAVIIREPRFMEGRQVTSVTVLIEIETSGRGETYCTPGGETGFTQNKTIKNKTIKNSPSTKVEEGVQSTEGFDQFWEPYPKKVGKQAARKAYLKIVKTVDPACVLSGLLSQKQFLIDQKKRGFCPDPATWLNDGRWDDEVTPLRHSKQREDRPEAGSPEWYEWRVQKPGEMHDQWQLRLNGGSWD